MPTIWLFRKILELSRWNVSIIIFFIIIVWRSAVYRYEHIILGINIPINTDRDCWRSTKESYVQLSPAYIIPIGSVLKRQLYETLVTDSVLVNRGKGEHACTCTDLVNPSQSFSWCMAQFKRCFSRIQQHF